MRRYAIYRESDHKYLTKTLILMRGDCGRVEWGQKKDAVLFTGSTLPPMHPGEQIEELPSKG
jgi:hypothetical protein